MDNQQLNEQIKKQEKENQEYLNNVLPEVQKKLNELCKEYGIFFGAKLNITPDGIFAAPAIRKATETNPYKQP